MSEDARLARVESRIDTVDARLAEIQARVMRQLDAIASEVHTMRLEHARAAGAAAARAEEDTEIRRLPAEVRELRAGVAEIRGWGSRRPALVQLAESEHGRALALRILVAAVLCSMALSGGLVSADLPGLARSVMAPPVVVPMPVPPSGMQSMP